MATNMVNPDPSELLEVVVDGQQTSPTTSVQCETDPTAVDRVVVYDDLTYTPPSSKFAIRELISLAATQRVILTPSQLHTIKQGFCCVVCLKFIKEPVFAQCCRSIIGCKTCVERWQQTFVHCPKCRGNTAGNNIFDVTGLSEAFSVLRPLFEED